MPRRFTEEQLEFWRELLAPFEPHELSTVPARGSKKPLTYVDKRALTNRLDTVCGPDGWYPEYEATHRGYRCRLYILVPTRAGTWIWMHKEDGAGFEEMGSKNRETGEWECDVDNDEKSGYTNAFRRAAQDAWGIARYLYGKGIPGFLDPNARPLAAETPSTARPTATPPPAAPPPPPQAPAQPPPSQAAGQPRQYNNFVIPKPGRGVFAWAKSHEQHFKTSLIEGMKASGDQRGYGAYFDKWTQEQVEDVCREVIDYLRSLENYQGEFDAIAAPAPSATPAPSPLSPPDPNLAAAKKELARLATALVERQLQRKPEPGEVIAAIGNIASEAANGQGHKGEVLRSLKECDDSAWIANMIAFATDQIARATEPQRTPEQDDIPF